jgi:hypothetical protein
VSDQRYPPLRPQPPLRPHRRRPGSLPLLAGAVVLAILVVLLLVVLLSRPGPGDTTSSPGTSGSPATEPASSAVAGSDSAAASASASAVPTAPPPVVAPPGGILPVGSVVEVTAGQLRIRQAPATTAPIVTSANAGDELYLVTNATALGPVTTGGFVWYLALYQAGYHDWPISPPEPPLSGWVAAGSESESFLSLSAATCPLGEIDITTLYGLTAWERLACLGDRQITVEGTYGCGECGGQTPGAFTPEWLAHPLDPDVFRPPLAQAPTVVESLVLRIPPELPQVSTDQAGSVLRVTGHFNDARSAECVVAPGEPGQERIADEAAAEWYCREQFVVDSWEVIGTDPDYPTG